MNKEYLSFTLLFLSPYGDKLGGNWNCTLAKLKARVEDYIGEGYIMERIYYEASKEKSVLIYDDGRWLITLSMFRA